LINILKFFKTFKIELFAYFASFIIIVAIGYFAKTWTNPAIFVPFYDLEFKYLSLGIVSKDIANIQVGYFNWFDQTPKYLLHLLGGGV
jgi:hypothetical protein